MSKLFTKHISQFSLDDINELISFVNSPAFRNRENELWADKRDEIRASYEKNKAVRDKAKEKLENEIAPALKKYAQNYLFMTDIVKFQGASSGGYRQIVQINESTILGLVVRWDRMKKTWEPTGYYSENSIEKLSEVYLSSLDNNSPMLKKCWFNRKSIVEFINKQK